MKRFEVSALDGAKLVDGPLRSPRPAAGEQLVKDHPDGEQIGPCVQRQAARLLGGHVPQLALHEAGARPSTAVAGEGDPEIRELHLTFVRKEDVRRGDVPMDEAGQDPLRRRQSAEDGARDVGRHPLRQIRARGRQSGRGHRPAERPEVVPADELEDEERSSVALLPDREQGHDVGVAHAGEQARLLPEVADADLARAREPFHANFLGEGGAYLSRAIDRAAASGADPFQELVPNGRAVSEHARDLVVGIGSHPLPSTVTGTKLRAPCTRLTWPGPACARIVMILRTDFGRRFRPALL